MAAPAGLDHGGSQDGEAGPELVQIGRAVAGVARVAGASAAAWATAAFVAVPCVAVDVAAVPAAGACASCVGAAGDPHAQRSPTTVRTSGSRRIRELAAPEA